jgi:hypothetical protein
MDFYEKNEYLKEKVNRFIATYGVKANHICEQTKINNAYFSKWRNGKKYLSIESMAAVDKYLHNITLINDYD